MNEKIRKGLLTDSIIKKQQKTDNNTKNTCYEWKKDS